MLCSNSINKQCDNNPSGSGQSTYLRKQSNGSIKTVRSEPWTLWTTYSRPCCIQTDWLQYRYGQGDWKYGQFTAVVQPTSLLQQNRQTPLILVFTSYQNLDIFAIWLNSMFEMILSLILRIKYDDSRNRNNFVMRIIHHVKKNRNYTGISVIPFYLLCLCVILKLSSQIVW